MKLNTRNPALLSLLIAYLFTIACGGLTSFSEEQPTQIVLDPTSTSTSVSLPTEVILEDATEVIFFATPIPPTSTPLPTSTPDPNTTTTPAPPAEGEATPDPSVGSPRVSSVSITAQRVGSPPAIDGNLNDWGTLTKLANTVVFQASYWVNSIDHSSHFEITWDDNALYIATQVEDDIYVQTQSGELMFAGDSVELLLDADLNSDRYSRVLSHDDYQIGFSPGSPQPGSGPVSYLWFPWSKSGVRHDIAVAAQATSTGYQLEAAIPWSVFGVTPQTGREYGFGFSVNDNDTPNTAYQQSMISIIDTRVLANPTTWGIIKLVGGSEVVMLPTATLTVEDIIENEQAYTSSTGTIEFRGFRIVNVAEDTEIEGRAYVTIALDFADGSGPYSLDLDGLSTPITGPFSADGGAYVEFVVPAICGASMAHIVEFSTGSGTLTRPLYFETISCAFN